MDGSDSRGPASPASTRPELRAAQEPDAQVVGVFERVAVERVGGLGRRRHVRSAFGRRNVQAGALGRQEAAVDAFERSARNRQLGLEVQRESDTTKDARGHRSFTVIGTASRFSRGGRQIGAMITGTPRSHRKREIGVRARSVRKAGVIGSLLLAVRLLSAASSARRVGLLGTCVLADQQQTGSAMVSPSSHAGGPAAPCVRRGDGLLGGLLPAVKRAHAKHKALR